MPGGVCACSHIGVSPPSLKLRSLDGLISVITFSEARINGGIDMQIVRFCPPTAGHFKVSRDVTQNRRRGLSTSRRNERSETRPWLPQGFASLPWRHGVNGVTCGAQKEVAALPFFLGRVVKFEIRLSCFKGVASAGQKLI